MFSPILSAIQALILAGSFVIGPVAPLPSDLEMCILKAEVCVQNLPVDQCGGLPDASEVLVCSEPYETCAQGFKEAQDLNCRIDYVWCKLESTTDKEPEQSDFLKFCKEVYETCPSV